MKKALVIIVILLSATGHSSAQQSDSIATGTTIFGLPLVFYTPETRWGFGAAGFLSWRFEGEPVTSRPSQVQLGGAYTLENQILSYLPFQLYWDDEKYTVFGELGWYRYNYFFFGIGNDVPAGYEELYGVNYPRLRATFMRETYPDLYAGIRIIADDFKITELDSDGLLLNENITGVNGGLTSGAGLIVNFDNRDNYFETHSGWFAAVSIDKHGKYLASDYDYTRLTIDIRKFFEFTPKDIFGVNFFSEDIYGDAPFISLALLGGTKRLRGFYEGRYRDNTSAIVQAEYRRNIIGRFGAVLFGGTGMVGESYGDLSIGNLKSTYGAGLRFALNKEDRINIRIDAGIGNGQAAYYITVGEAF